MPTPHSTESSTVPIAATPHSTESPTVPIAATTHSAESPSLPIAATTHSAESIVSPPPMPFEALPLLPHHEQVQLMTLLADGVEGDDETDGVEGAWIAEAKRRLAGIRAGERIPVQWEAVEARLLSE